MGLAVTLPQFRGKGPASALTRKAMNFLLGKSWISFGFAWKRRIKASINLLSRLGFRVIVIGGFW